MQQNDGVNIMLSRMGLSHEKNVIPDGFIKKMMVLDCLRLKGISVCFYKQVSLGF